jgi:hypothetical protein
MPNYGDALTAEQIEQVRTDCKQLVASGVKAADAKKHLAKTWKKSLSRMRGICDGINNPVSIREPLDATAVAGGIGKITTLAELEDDDPRIKETIEAERDALQWKDKARTAEKRNRHLENELTDVRKLLEAAEATKQITPKPITASKGKSADGEAVAVAVASDWHMGAIIRPNTVNFLNEVNPEITAARIQRYFIALVKLVKKEQQHVRIDKLVLALIGDFIENYLHPELIEEATMSPIQQMIEVQNCIVAGIDYVLKETELTIVAPTCSGNHGRTTEKTRASTEFKNSYEQLLYWNLAKHYASEPRIVFQVGDGYFNYLDVYDHKLRFHHGHSCKFGGGIGGLMIPLRKFVHRANQQIYADTSICGHFHSLIVDYDILVNGSLVGPSAYSIRLGFPPERPQQILRLLDAKRGWTIFAPILVAEQEKKSGRIVG